MQRVLMCKPDHFRVDYQINPWMKPGTVDFKKANEQWKKLVSTYEELGVQVDTLVQNEDYPDMVFAADQGVLYEGNKVLLSRFRYPERQGEGKFYRDWYLENGFEVVDFLENIFFEGGGELQKFRDKLLIGTGFRTSKNAGSAVGEILGCDDVLLDLIDDRFYHLDTCLMVLDDEVIFYYPPAFSQDARDLIKGLGANSIEFSEEDVLGFAPNSVRVNDVVLIQSGNENFGKKVQNFGYDAEFIDVGEFIKAGGGIHCLTGELE